MPESYPLQPPDIVTWTVSPNVWGCAVCILLAIGFALALIGFWK